MVVPQDRRPLSLNPRRGFYRAADDHGCKVRATREHQITYFHDGPDPIVTASNYGGSKHPQWYYNLKAHPECELGDEKFLAR